jgi:hypothetical protein
MDIQITVDDKAAKRLLSRKQKQLKAEIKRGLIRAAFRGIKLIGERMDAGKEIKGGNFKPYDREYALFRRSKGRGTKPDLQFTRRMRQSMVSRATSKEARIFFSRPEEAKKAQANNKTRPFFGFNQRDESEIKRVFFKAIK